LVFPPGATTGARIVIDANGVVIYGPDNHPLFVASPDGDVPGNDITDAPAVFGVGGGGGLHPATFSVLRFIAASYLTSLGYTGPSVQAFPGFFIQTADGNNNPITSSLGVYGYDGLSYAQVNPLIVAPGIRFGGGFSGKYYYEEFALPATSLANSVALATRNYSTVVQQTNDYPSSAYSGGVWTAPDEGIYHFEAGMAFIVAAAATNCSIAFEPSPNGSAEYARVDQSVTAGRGVFMHLSADLHMTQGQTLVVTSFQNSGAAVNTIAGRNSHFSARRIL
jgi:hypothetical protein